MPESQPHPLSTDSTPLGGYRLLRPILFSLPPEAAHRLALHGLTALSGLPGVGAMLRAAGGGSVPRHSALQVSLWGRTFPHPLGLAAGLDKDGMALSAFLDMGFAFVEVGTVTPRPQPGNPRPRLFRLPEDKALINRMGFNNHGADALANRLSRFRARRPQALVGVNLGKNKDTPLSEAAEDYRLAYERVAGYADFITVNVSSPNTPGLRDLQTREALEPIVRTLAGLRDARATAGEPRTPLLVKVAPDLDDAGLAAVVDVALAHGCDGLIAVNTTLARPKLTGRYRGEAGGLSGSPLHGRAVEVVATLFRRSGGQLPLIGVGGLFGPDQAFALIRAGASLVQAYTGFIYRGPGLVRSVTDGLARCVAEQGVGSIAELVGTDA